MRIKLEAIWRILRGHPVCYRMFFTYKISISTRTENAYIAECTFVRDADPEGIIAGIF